MLPQCFLSVAHAAVIRTTLVRPYSQPCFWESFRAQLRRTQMGIPSDSSVIPQCFLYSSGLVLCCYSLLCSRELNVSCFLYVFLRARFILPFLALFPRAKCFVFLCAFLRDLFMLFSLRCSRELNVVFSFLCSCGLVVCCLSLLCSRELNV